MFNKRAKLTVLTKLEEGDNIKVSRVIDMYVDPKTVTDVKVSNDGTVSITFTTLESLVNQIQHDLLILNLADIYAEVVAK